MFLFEVHPTSVVLLHYTVLLPVPVVYTVSREGQWLVIDDENEDRERFRNAPVLDSACKEKRRLKLYSSNGCEPIRVHRRSNVRFQNLRAVQIR